MKGELRDLTIGLGGELLVTLSLPMTNMSDMKKLHGVDVDVEIKKWREKRSITANAYCWVLVTKIAEKMRPPFTKDDVYLEMLKRYGQSGMISVRTDRLEQVQRAIKYWERAGEGTVNGVKFTHLRYWIGSSHYDTAEMALFLDGIVSECKELNIETLPPRELERLKMNMEEPA